MDKRIKVVTRYFEMIVLCPFLGKGFFYCVRQDGGMCQIIFQATQINIEQSEEKQNEN